MDTAKVILSKSGQRMAEIYGNRCLEYQRSPIGFSLHSEVKRKGYTNYVVYYSGEELTFKRRIDYNRVTLKWLNARGFTPEEINWYTQQEKLNCTKDLLRILKNTNPHWCIKLMVCLMDVDKKKEYAAKCVNESFIQEVIKNMTTQGITLPNKILNAIKTEADYWELLELSYKARGAIAKGFDHTIFLSAYFACTYATLIYLALLEAETRKYYTPDKVLDRQKIPSRMTDIYTYEVLKHSAVFGTTDVMDIGFCILGYYDLVSSNRSSPRKGKMTKKEAIRFLSQRLI